MESEEKLARLYLTARVQENIILKIFLHSDSSKSTKQKFAYNSDIKLSILFIKEE